MKRPTEQEIGYFLQSSSAEFHYDGPSATSAVRIDGFAFEPSQAMRIAELCLLTGQPLSAVITPDMLLGLARRIADIEEQLAAVPVTGIRHTSSKGPHLPADLREQVSQRLKDGPHG